YKITYGTPRPASFDLVGATNAELVAYHLHRNEWFVRHSRRILQERWAAGQDMSDVVDRLHRMLAEQADVTRQLRALWTLHAIDGLSDELLTGLLDQSDEHLRIWAIRLLCEDHGPPVRARQRMLELAQTDPAPAVRLELACSLQRLAGEPRWAIAAALAARAEDAGDANLPLMIWYGIEPLVDHDAERFVGMTGTARMPLVRRHGARRASSSTRRQQALEQLSRLLAGTDDTEQRQDLLQGILQGLSGSRSVPMPASWPEAYGALRGQGNMQIQEQSLELALIFDDPVALRSLRELAVDRHAEPPRRIRAIQALVAKHVPELASLLLQLLPVPEVRGAALRGLAEFDDPRIIDAILDQYATFGASDRQDALMTLASRPAWAAALLSAIESARVPRTDLTTYTVRQIRSLGDSALAEKLVALWGEVRDTPADKSRLIANYKRRLTTDVLDRADLGNGRAVFHKTCANCHRLFDAGGNIGPELTGAQRRNLDYVLENMIDPSAAVAKDFQMQVIVTATGRVVTGLVVDEAPQSVTVQTINERVVIPVDEIEMREIAGVSMMPEGLLQSLDTDQVRDLVAYLASARQVPLPELTDQPSSP
ncbi:MAG: c-type cytochrome, partial [Pirellulaceae bacterium]